MGHVMLTCFDPASSRSLKCGQPPGGSVNSKVEGGNGEGNFVEISGVQEVSLFLVFLIYV